ncbi:NAD(P)-binding protein [Aspergillus saccharolyticus JOP 1030-1]|uniref:NAD(P)-binding protein n=1 Tax=Aspergillus saccharolyticus JOP 1030-1 TaxID=1450539 RepID=A0A318ZTR9_9EURO|nr:NAD(P)-binding protein [Aspergillus saccharolyticus JOP 1030-1]PYH43478.1 NAD(P)-binding protein [Aspergillus saccharolyticus JOP 1030-1]
MIPLRTIQASNRLIASDPPVFRNPIALFVGATSGIGEATVKQFAQHTLALRPRVYLLGRNSDAGHRIVQDCQALNPTGEFHFLPVDVSLLSAVDEISAMLLKKEPYLNLLFLSTGTAAGKTETRENLRTLTSLLYYSRLRFTINLLPLLQSTPPGHLRRVISVLSGGYEGPIVDVADLDGRRLSMREFRGQVSSATTLAMETLAEQAPTVSFINQYPGTVRSGLFRDADSWYGWVVWAVLLVIGWLVYLPTREVAERHVFLATSARFQARERAEKQRVLVEGVEVARGTDGRVGSGVYSVWWDGETSGEEVMEILRGLRREGMREAVWRVTESVFVRVTGKVRVEV